MQRSFAPARFTMLTHFKQPRGLLAANRGTGTGITLCTCTCCELGQPGTEWHVPAPAQHASASQAPCAPELLTPTTHELEGLRLRERGTDTEHSGSSGARVL